MSWLWPEVGPCLGRDLEISRIGRIFVCTRRLTEICMGCITPAFFVTFMDLFNFWKDVGVKNE